MYSSIGRARRLTALVALAVLAGGCAPALRSVAERPAAPVPLMTAQLQPGDVQQLVRLMRKRRPALTAGMAEHIATYLLTYARQQGVDHRLAAAIVAVESGFDPQARSRAGALGLGQLMPDTARALKVTRPLDPAANLAGTIRLLRQLGDAWRGHPRMIELVTASYRAGLGQVQRWMAAGTPLPAYMREYIDAVNVWYRAVEEAKGT